MDSHGQHMHQEKKPMVADQEIGAGLRQRKIVSCRLPIEFSF